MTHIRTTLRTHTRLGYPALFIFNIFFLIHSFHLKILNRRICLCHEVWESRKEKIDDHFLSRDNISEIKKRIKHFYSCILPFFFSTCGLLGTDRRMRLKGKKVKILVKGFEMRKKGEIKIYLSVPVKAAIADRKYVVNLRFLFSFKSLFFVFFFLITSITGCVCWLVGWSVSLSRRSVGNAFVRQSTCQTY